MERRQIRENSIFESLRNAGYSLKDLLPAFPGDTPSDVETRMRDNRLRYSRTVEPFGYLGTRECRSTYFNVTAEGYRRSPAEAPVDWGRHRIVACFGGSTTAGHNVGDCETWPYYLEQLLAMDEPDVRVVNYGAGGHTLMHASLALLHRCMSGRAPNDAVFLTGLNDCYYAFENPDAILNFLDTVLMLSQHDPGQGTVLSEIRNLIPQRGTVSETRSNSEVLCAVELGRVRALLSTRWAVATGILNICRNLWGVRLWRFWEPSQFLTPDLKGHLVPRTVTSVSSHDLAGALYRNVVVTGVRAVLGNREVIDLSDCGQHELGVWLYLDEASHATPAMNQHLARVIQHHISGRSTWFDSVQRLFSRRTRTNAESHPSPAVGKKSGPADSDLYPMW